MDILSFKSGSMHHSLRAEHNVHRWRVLQSARALVSHDSVISLTVYSIYS